MQLVFASNTYPADAHLAQRLAAQVQQHHPGAVHIFVGDGYTPDIPGAICIGAGTAKGSVASLPEYSHRLLAAALEYMTPGDYLIQMDPDCWVQRPIVPRTDCRYFGRRFGLPAHGLPVTVLHGGCWGMAYGLVAEAVEQHPFTPADYDFPENLRPDGSRSEDLGFCQGIAKLEPKARWRNWGELVIGWSDRAAICHAVKGQPPGQ